MNKLDRVYLSILRSGLVAIRNAAHAGAVEYIREEAEHLHEIPSLIGESNVQRHLYYFNQVRRAYLEWALKNGDEAVLELVNSYYAHPWREMEAIVQAGQST